MTTIKYQALSYTGYSVGVFKTREEAQLAAGFNGTVRLDICVTNAAKPSLKFSWE